MALCAAAPTRSTGMAPKLPSCLSMAAATSADLPSRVPSPHPTTPSASLMRAKTQVVRGVTRAVTARMFSASGIIYTLVYRQCDTERAADGRWLVLAHAAVASLVTGAMRASEVRENVRAAKDI